MKKILLISIAIISLYCIACKDKNIDPPHYDIEYLELYNKPLDTIRHYLNGKWQIHKAIGGTTFQILSTKNYFVEFKFQSAISNDSIKTYNDTAIFVNSNAFWSKEYTNIYIADSTYLLNYYTSNTSSNAKQIIHIIKNDTLIIRDNYVSGYASYCTKIK